MRNALLAGLLVATAACGAYHFPGPGGDTGTVSGQVIAYPCGPVEPANQTCMPYPCRSLQAPNQKCVPYPAGDCMPSNPNTGSCGGYPMPGLGLVFINGDMRLGTKTDSSGNYSIDLAPGTWTVSALNFGRIISGPEKLMVTAGANIVANYVVDTGIRAAA